MTRIIQILFFLFCCIQLNAQQLNVPLSIEITNSYLHTTEKLESNFHSSVKPYLASELNQLFPSSTYSNGKVDVWQNKYALKSSGDSVANDNSILVYGLVNLDYGLDLYSDNSIFQMGGGAGLSLTYKNKLALEGELFTQNSAYPNYLSRLADSLNILPGTNFVHLTNEGYSTTMGNFYLSYSPHKIFNLQVGCGKNFWGDGYRSLLLSDNAANYPYFKINTTFWRIKYTNLFAMMQDVRGTNGDPSTFTRKYVSMHFLNWNISKRVSLGIYESIVWQAKDTLLNRGFDVNYLNPVIFFRPVEYALGSSDNALLGLNLKVKITDQYQLYGQAILDEFLLKEVFGDSTGWWANKYGFQIGARIIEPFKIKNLQAQVEYNIVRPFTYSHGSIHQNFGHYNAALAHPLGANFKEWNFFLRYTFKNFQIEEQFTSSIFGADSSYESFGGNIYQSYANRYQEYNNVIGQGVRNNMLFHRLKLSYVVYPRINLRLFLQHTYRTVKTENNLDIHHYLQVGITTNMWNQYNDR